MGIYRRPNMLLRDQIGVGDDRIGVPGGLSAGELQGFVLVLANRGVSAERADDVHHAERRETEDHRRTVNRPGKVFFLGGFFEEDVFESVVEIRDVQSRHVLRERRFVRLELGGAEVFEGSGVVFEAGLEADVAEIGGVWDHRREDVPEHGAVGLAVLDFFRAVRPSHVED
ncbi:hypothetical protein U1Q18_016380, partial [Sarracenia purpurea var. burkii]